MNDYATHVRFCARCVPAAPDCPLGKRMYDAVWEEFGDEKTPTPSKASRDLAMLCRRGVAMLDGKLVEIDEHGKVWSK